MARIVHLLRASRWALAAAAAVIVAALVAIIQPWEALSPEPEPPVPVISASLDGPLDVLSGAGPTVGSDAATSTVIFLTELYSRAFLPPLPPPSDEPEATPVPRPAASELVSDAARPSFEAQRDAWDAGRGVDVLRGEVTFQGMVSAEGDTTHAVLVDVGFEAQGVVENEDSDEVAVRLNQHGQLLLVWTEHGWRVDGFDVTLEVHMQVPPSDDPSPQAFRARWMP